MTCSWVSHGYVPLLILYLTVYLLLITLNTSDLVHRFRDCLIHVYQVRSWFENRAAFTFGRDTGDEGKSACISTSVAPILIMNRAVHLRYSDLLLSQRILHQDEYHVPLFTYMYVITAPSLSQSLTSSLTAQDLRTWFWKASIVTIVLLVTQFISTILVTLLQCRPIPKYWNKDLLGTCIDINAFFYCKQDLISETACPCERWSNRI